jgi:DNA-binding MarR family transcriptional regulator
MGRLQDILRWSMEHWAVITSIVGFGGWILSARSKRQTLKQVKNETEIDSKIIEALENRQPASQVTTGGGEVIVWAQDLADHLSLDKDVVFESLERLEAAGRVRKSEGNMQNRAPRWFILRR